MAHELKPIEVSDIPELLQIAEEVQASGEPRVLQSQGEDLAILTPAKRRRRASSRGRPLTRDDALFRLIGIGRSDIPGGVSGKKHEYLAESHRQDHR